MNEKLRKKGNQMNKNAEEKFRKSIVYIYAAILIAVAIIFIVNFLFKSSGGFNYGLESFDMANSLIKDEEGNEFDISKIDKYINDEYNSVSVYYQVPKDIKAEQTIVFRSKNAYIFIKKDGNVIYRTDIANAPFYNNSPGTRWNMFSVTKEDAGKTIEIKVELAYADGRAKIDNFMVGDRAAIVVNIIKQKIFGIIISMLIFMIGLIFIIANELANFKHTKRDDSLRYLGLFACIAAIWCLLETNVIQLFTEHLRLLQTTDDMMLVIGGTTLLIYSDIQFKIFSKLYMRIITGFFVVYNVIAIILQMIGLYDFHQTLNGAVSSYAVVVVTLVIGVSKSALQNHKISRNQLHSKKKYYIIYQQIGIALLALCVGVDLIRYLNMDVMDRAMATRVGLLLFVIFFGIGNMYRLAILIKQGMEAEFVSKLAYKDGLTELGNRTAYMEQLQEIVESTSKKQLGIVMCDINDLKKTNDNIGHSAGDKLIIESSKILNKVYGHIGNVYRIGGDEFVVIILDENTAELVISAEKVFEQEVKIANERLKEKNEPFKVVIAHGSSITNDTSRDSVDRAIEEADKLMYKNKYEIKMNI